MILASTSEEGIRWGDFEVAREVAEAIEILAIAVISVGVATSIIAFLIQWSRSDVEAAFDKFKLYIARGLLIGLDLLIAADVIKTVTLEGTLESAAVLGLLVVIRTFLSWTLVLEVDKCWPWQRDRRADTDATIADGTV